MLDSEKLRLQWNDFEDNVKAAFGQHRGSKEFSDVTLACEDGQQVEAHKIILASSSPFFKDILKRNKHPHPLIYMKGVKSENLMAIVDCLFWGSKCFPGEFGNFPCLGRGVEIEWTCWETRR